jgi:murein DD-endopeptidase MepM/ murein hydrolase activator NlpD
MNSAIHKAAILMILIGVLLSACGSSLWGTYDPYYSTTSVPTSTIPDVRVITATPIITVSPVPSTATALPTSTKTLSPTSTFPKTTVSARPSIAYTSQSGDSLNVIAIHFGIQAAEIISSLPLPESGFINPGTLMFIPDKMAGTATTPSDLIIPDSELVDSPSAVGFDIQAYVNTAEGRLSTFHEYMTNVGTITGAEGVERISLGSSISPRLLLAIIQYYTGWVQGLPKPNLDEKTLLGYDDPNFPGLYQQMRLMVRDLLTGYYSWRAGTLTELTFPDGMRMRLAPTLNAGSVALQFMFSRHLNYADWLKVIDPTTGFTALYEGMFGDPFIRAEELGPLFPPDLNQPTFTLPFEVGALWAFTGGPHPAWEQESAMAALDFAPASATSGCVDSNAWVVAIASGWIVRSEIGYVVIDLDPDGFEQTGWDVLYQHIATKDRIKSGTRVAAGDRIGHPSCEGGTATGTHVHITRKYNGEWVAAGGPLPFVMSGWTAHAGNAQYKGTLTKGDQTITANQSSTHESQIIRQPGE